jgi:hypothetical protein
VAPLSLKTLVSISFGVFALLTQLVYLPKSGVGGLRGATAWTAIDSLQEQ